MNEQAVIAEVPKPAKVFIPLTRPPFVGPDYKPFNLDEEIARQGNRPGIGPHIGTWPGDETEEEFLAMLEELD